MGQHHPTQPCHLVRPVWTAWTLEECSGDQKVQQTSLVRIALSGTGLAWPPNRRDD